MKIKITRKIRERLNKVANAAGAQTVWTGGLIATKIGGPAEPTVWSLRDKCGEAAVMSEVRDPKNPIWRELDLVAIELEPERQPSGWRIEGDRLASPSGATFRMDDLLTLNEAAEVSGMSAGYLRVATHRRTVPAVKRGRNWFLRVQWAVDKAKERGVLN